MTDKYTHKTGWLTAATGAGQHLWTIPPTAAFIDTLADGLLAEADGDPARLAAITVIVPTRRASRSLREAFLRRSEGKALLLPRLMPLQDVDEDEALLSGFAAGGAVPLDIPPAMSPLMRRLLLTKLILAGPQEGDRPATPEQAARLAEELARFLDEVQTERLGFSELKNLVPDQYAIHWQVILDFLKLVTEHWPSILTAHGALDPAEHRNRVFAAQSAAWQMNPPEGLIVAAGSTGSIPATADLLATVAGLPHGCVVLAGLDEDLDENSWASLDEAHPQYGLRALLGKLNAGRAEIGTWPESAGHGTAAARVELVREAMRPPATTEAWRHMEHLKSDATTGMQWLECAGPREEAAAIALIMRWSLEEPARTCALITPDRSLARRVSAELERWDLEVDDSGGRPLAETPPAVFLRLIADMVAEEFAPVPLLAAFKHPLAAGGLDTAAFRTRVRALEKAVLRGPRPSPGLDGVRRLAAALDDPPPELDHWLADLEAHIKPFTTLMAEPQASVGDLLNAHVALAEGLADTADTAGPLRLWAHEDGEALARFIADLAGAAETLDPIAPAHYPGLLDALMTGLVVRPTYGTHPRLSILGPLEGRLLRPDVLILGGLNEGTWPAETTTDAWMSRPMRKTFGLPLPERRIGLSAHDVSQALCAPDVILTRSQKVDGAPTVPSRWWRRLEQVLTAAGLEMDTGSPRFTWRAWAADLIKPERVTPSPPPEPRPPVEARPRRLSVTRIETLMRDPYAVYADRILGLRALDPIDADASAAEYGTIVHGVLQAFIDAMPSGPLPDDAEQRFIDLGRDAFTRAEVRPGVLAFWQPRLARIAAWVVAEENRRRSAVTRSHTEIGGEIVIKADGGPFKLTAKADRIDQLSDGTLAIIDYKTGEIPGANEVAAGFAPQLPLEAVIAAAGGFAGLDAAETSELSYWKLTGRGDGGKTQSAGKDPGALRDTALAGLRTLINTFDKADTAYPAQPHPDRAPKYNDYQHLARVKEWASGTGGDE